VLAAGKPDIGPKYRAEAEGSGAVWAQSADFAHPSMRENRHHAPISAK